MEKRVYYWASFFLFALINGCAFDLVHVKQIPAQMELTELPKSRFELEEEINVSLGTGYSRKLRQGTKWDCVGAVQYGNVYKTKDQILTVEGSNIYEAFIVVSSGKLVGFYLPVEQCYSPLKKPKDIHMKEINSE